MIYKPQPADGYEWVGCVDQHDYDVFQNLDGTPRADSWRPIRMRRYAALGGRAGKANDFPWLNVDLIMRRHAVDALRSLMEPYGEFLPLATDDDVELFIFNVTRVIDGLDEDRSVLKRYEDGGVMWVDKFVFRESVVRGVDVFKLTSFLAMTYVSERFVSAVTDAGLVGLEFELLWTPA